MATRMHREPTEQEVIARSDFDRAERMVQHLRGAAEEATRRAVAWRDYEIACDERDGYAPDYCIVSDAWLEHIRAENAAGDALMQGRFMARRFVAEQRRSEEECEREGYPVTTIWDNPTWRERVEHSPHY